MLFRGSLGTIIKQRQPSRFVEDTVPTLAVSFCLLSLSYFSTLLLNLTSQPALSLHPHLELGSVIQNNYNRFTIIKNTKITPNLEGIMSKTMITQLEAVIAQRQADMPEGSYTTYLFSKGQDKILKKVGEEAAETIIASKNNDPQEIVAETSDLIYHLLVLLAHHKISFNEIEAELERRHLKAKQ